MAVTVDLDDLERIARAATQDKWQWHDLDGDARRDAPGNTLEGVHDGQVVLFAESIGESNPRVIASVSDRAHIAANSPPITLALIARIRELESVAGELVEVYDGEGYPDEAAATRVLVAKGAVLP